MVDVVAITEDRVVNHTGGGRLFPSIDLLTIADMKVVAVQHGDTVVPRVTIVQALRDASPALDHAVQARDPQIHLNLVLEV